MLPLGWAKFGVEPPKNGLEPLQIGVEPVNVGVEPPKNMGSTPIRINRIL